MPGDTIGNFGSALHLLGDRSSYLYADGDRFWFDRQPSLNRKVSERADSYSEADVWAAVVERLRKTEPHSTPEFPDVVIAPTDSSEVAESDRVRLVIAHPKFSHDGKGRESSARSFAENLVAKRGTAPRLNANTLVVLAADQLRLVELEQAVRQHLAWTEIRRDKDVLDLTQGQVTEAGKKVDALNLTVAQRIRETWIWALYPEQSDGSQPFRVTATKTDGATESLARFAGERLRKSDVIIVQSSPQSIVLELGMHLRSKWNDGRITVADLWEYHARYPYLTRLRDKQVLLDAIAAVMNEIAWNEIGFALADDYDDDSGDFEGLRIPLLDPAPAMITDAMFLVSPELARKQRERDDDVKPPGEGLGFAIGTGSSDGKTMAGGSDSGQTAPEPDPDTVIENARYSAAVDLKPGGDLAAQLRQIADELLVHLQGTDPDTFEVRLTVDAGKRAGFPADVVRTVRENGTNLGFGKNPFRDL
mgnify:CR=1 FL=1